MNWFNNKYVIINFNDIPFKDWPRGDKIPEHVRPTWLHYDKELAERELRRLKQKYPDGDFVLFESIAIMKELATNKGVFNLQSTNQQEDI